MKDKIKALIREYKQSKDAICKGRLAELLANYLDDSKLNNNIVVDVGRVAILQQVISDLSELVK